MFALLKINNSGEIEIVKMNLSKDALQIVKAEKEENEQDYLRPYLACLEKFPDDHWSINQLEEQKKKYVNQYVIKGLLFTE